jgi:hypothetical protein
MGTENESKIPFSVKFDKTTAGVIEELRKKPTGGKLVRNSVIENLIETNPTFIKKLSEINKEKKKK